MAELEQIQALRVKVDESGSDMFDDATIGSVIDQAEGDLNAAAAVIWETKAARYSRLVNVSESGSSRSMGDLYKNALQMHKLYADKVAAATDPATTGKSRTRTAKRV